MKKVFCVILAICMLFLSSGCRGNEENKDEKMIGVWVTYSELKSFATSKSGFENEFSLAVQRCKKLGINNMFVHVRAFCDAAYNSKYFPKCEYFGDTDALAVMVRECHKNGIKIHAWINPYRVSNSPDKSLLPENSPARAYLEDADTSNDKNVCITDGGIYLNPASSQVRRLILCGIREILDNYKVDGIHFDDYFYPTVDAKFDEASYKEYADSTENPLWLEDWRRQNVNTLLNSCYCAVKQAGSDILFGVSPAADINRCYNTLFADIEGWLGGGYVDYIMPQLYFGFEYPKESFRFDALLVKWLDIIQNKPAVLYCGLANYKIGTDTPADKEEWNKYDDIIARQIEMLCQNGVRGFAFFSYTSLFNECELNRIQMNKIERELKKKGS